MWRQKRLPGPPAGHHKAALLCPNPPLPLGQVTGDRRVHTAPLPGPVTPVACWRRRRAGRATSLATFPLVRFPSRWVPGSDLASPRASLPVGHRQFRGGNFRSRRVFKLPGFQRRRRTGAQLDTQPSDGVIRTVTRQRPQGRGRQGSVESFSSCTRRRDGASRATMTTI